MSELTNRELIWAYWEAREDWEYRRKNGSVVDTEKAAKRMERAAVLLAGRGLRRIPEPHEYEEDE